MNRKDQLASILLLLGLLLVPVGTALAEEEPTLTVRYRSSAWTYSHEELLALATERIGNMRGTGDKPAIPFEVLVLEKTGIPLDEIDMVVTLRGSSQPVILRGNELAMIYKLVLASGEDKPTGEPHEWALATEDEETYQALARTFGSRRKHHVYRIDITPKLEPAP